MEINHIVNIIQYYSTRIGSQGILNYTKPLILKTSSPNPQSQGPSP